MIFNQASKDCVLKYFAALILLMRLVYDDVLVDHDNPIVLAIFIRY